MTFSTLRPIGTRDGGDLMQVLKGANITAQWYQDAYLGLFFAYLEKVCLHTTETKGWPGYSGGASAPNATYHPLLRSIRQHFENNRSARALRDPSDTFVRENRDRVWQLEIVAYSDYALARSVGGLWIGDLRDEHYEDIAWMLIQLHRDLGLPLTSQIRWAEGQKTYVSGRRLSSSGWDACRGIATHFAVSGNTHWDAGGFFYSRLAAKILELLTPVPIPIPPKGSTEMPLIVTPYGAGGARPRAIDTSSRTIVALSELGYDRLRTAAVPGSGIVSVALPNADVEAFAHAFGQPHLVDDVGDNV
jgi:hypothetical protein